MFLIGKFHRWLADRNTEKPLDWTKQYAWPPSEGTWGFGIFVAPVPPTPPPSGSDMLKQIATAAGANDISTNSVTYVTTGTAVTLTTQGTSAIVFVHFVVDSATALTCRARINMDSGTAIGSLGAQYTGDADIMAFSGHAVFSGLTPGSHTFTLEWRSGNGSYTQRNLANSDPTGFPRIVTVLDIG
jgi:hypothetical protein